MKEIFIELVQQLDPIKIPETEKARSIREPLENKIKELIKNGLLNEFTNDELAVLNQKLMTRSYQLTRDHGLHNLYTAYTSNFNEMINAFNQFSDDKQNEKNVVDDLIASLTKAQAIGQEQTLNILEFGPGEGNISQKLLEAILNASKTSTINYIAFERDAKLLDALKKNLKNNLHLAGEQNGTVLTSPRLTANIYQADVNKDNITQMVHAKPNIVFISYVLPAMNALSKTFQTLNNVSDENALHIFVNEENSDLEKLRDCSPVTLRGAKNSATQNLNAHFEQTQTDNFKLAYQSTLTVPRLTTHEWRKLYGLQQGNYCLNAEVFEPEFALKKSLLEFIIIDKFERFSFYDRQKLIDHLKEYLENNNYCLHSNASIQIGLSLNHTEEFSKKVTLAINQYQQPKISNERNSTYNPTFFSSSLQLNPDSGDMHQTYQAKRMSQ